MGNEIKEYIQELNNCKNSIFKEPNLKLLETKIKETLKHEYFQQFDTKQNLDYMCDVVKENGRPKEAIIIDYEASKEFGLNNKTELAIKEQKAIIARKELDKAKEHTAMAGITSVNVVNMKLSAGATAATEKGNYRTK